MNGAMFTINFRREAFEREQARSRRRIIGLASWLAYFGVLGLVLYAYALNYIALERRTTQVERQIAQFTGSHNLPRRILLDPAQTGAIERFHTSPRRWRDKLSRLAALLPPAATLTSIGLNASNSNQAADLNKLIIAGIMRPANEDPTREVVQLMATLQSDSVFAAGYQSIKLTQSRAGSTGGGIMEFTIECR